MKLNDSHPKATSHLDNGEKVPSSLSRVCHFLIEVSFGKIFMSNGNEEIKEK